MRCLICHGEDIQTKQVREEIKVDKNIICIPIQTPVCHTCGERYYDRRTVRYLEEMERKLQWAKYGTSPRSRKSVGTDGVNKTTR